MTLLNELLFFFSFLWFIYSILITVILSLPSHWKMNFFERLALKTDTRLSILQTLIGGVISVLLFYFAKESSNLLYHTGNNLVVSIAMSSLAAHLARTRQKQREQQNPPT